MARGRKQDFLGSIRVQAARVVQQLEGRIRALEGEIRHLMEQADAWRRLLIGGEAAPRAGAGRSAGRRRRASGGKRVDWNQVLDSLPKRFGVEDVMKHPGAAAKGRAQVYPALNRWEGAKRVRRVGKGVYEKAGSGTESAAASAKQTAARQSAGKAKPAKRAKRTKRGKKPGSTKAKAA